MDAIVYGSQQSNSSANGYITRPDLATLEGVTAGSTRLSAATTVNATVIPVAASAGFAVGQSITVGTGADQEAATIAQVQGGRGGARLTVTAPLEVAHAAGAPVAGSGITLSAPLTRDHPHGAGLSAEAPTPGAPNRYSAPRTARP